MGKVVTAVAVSRHMSHNTATETTRGNLTISVAYAVPYNKQKCKM